MCKKKVRPIWFSLSLCRCDSVRLRMHVYVHYLTDSKSKRLKYFNTKKNNKIARTTHWQLLCPLQTKRSKKKKRTERIECWLFVIKTTNKKKQHFMRTTCCHCNQSYATAAEQQRRKQYYQYARSCVLVYVCVLLVLRVILLSFQVLCTKTPLWVSIVS